MNLKRHLSLQNYRNLSGVKKRNVINKWDISDGWNYWEILTVKDPAFMQIAIHCEIDANELFYGPSEFSSVKKMFTHSWQKELSNTMLERIYKTSGTIKEVDTISFTDSLTIFSSISKNDTTFGRVTCENFMPTKFYSNENNTEEFTLFYSYTDDLLDELCLRQTYSSVNSIDVNTQNCFKFTYDENNIVQSRVQTIEELSKDDKDSIIGTVLRDSATYNFDSNARLAELLTYKFDTTYYLNEKVLFTYSSDGLLELNVKSRWDVDSQDLVDAFKTEITYNTNGDIINVLKSVYSNGQFVPDENETFQYDERGNLVKEYAYLYSNGTKELDDSTSYVYDDGNNLIEYDVDYASGGGNNFSVEYNDGYPQLIKSSGGSMTELSFSQITPIVHQFQLEQDYSSKCRVLQNKLFIDGFDHLSAPEVALFTLQGKKITTLVLDSGDKSLYSLEGIAKGMYLLNISAASKSYTSKIRVW